MDGFKSNPATFGEDAEPPVDMTCRGDLNPEELEKRDESVAGQSELAVAYATPLESKIWEDVVVGASEETTS